MSDALRLNGDLVDRARAAANAIADDIQQHIEEHTTDTTERATLRLLGIAGVNEIDVPLVNVVTEHARELLPGGIMRPFVDLMDQTGKSAQEVAAGVAAGDLALAEVPAERRAAAEARAQELAREGVARIDAVRARRNELVAQTGEPLKPYVYVIVATGNIYEDAAQAKAAARAGADVIAVIRTTAQSLLDYVPFGETTEGFGGTYATQENFRLMRAALDEVGEELGRYIRLCNYASGLCMPEIATMGALERLDMMLNDSMYGIIFRNINMQRTFVDQYLSRLINARAGIIINTGEDNYLTTADAFEKGFTVVSSDFINEAFALRANLEPWQIGLGHAFEINPATPDQVVYQIAD
ncbi:MAG: lysine 5,6-aminomutase subunit alpha TIM-barrel domain-containing protein, partial [Deltaproteobacteria bacterium]